MASTIKVIGNLAQNWKIMNLMDFVKSKTKIPKSKRTTMKAKSKDFPQLSKVIQKGNRLPSRATSGRISKFVHQSVTHKDFDFSLIFYVE